MRCFVLFVLQFSLVAFGLSLLLGHASAQHIMPAPPAPKSSVFGPESNMSTRKSSPPRTMQRPEQRKKRLAPVAPVPSPKFAPGIAIMYTPLGSV